MKRKVSIVLLPIDDFNDKIISDNSVNAVKEGILKKIALRKQDGYLIFTDICEEEIDITLTAYSYNTEKLHINLKMLNEINPLLKVRLKPNSQYKFPDGVTCIRGKTTPNSYVKLIHRCSSNLFMLFDDNKSEESRVKIYNPLNIDLEGKSFIIKDKEAFDGEFFNIIEFSSEDGMYTLDRPLKKSYKKEVTEIVKVDYVQISEDGQFIYPFKNISKENNIITVEKQNGEKRDFTLEIGVLNTLEFF